MTFTATVSTDLAKIGPPTGNVVFIDGKKRLGEGQTSGGMASSTTSNLSTGAHLIHAIFSGSAEFNPSASLPLSQQVNQ